MKRSLSIWSVLTVLLLNGLGYTTSLHAQFKYKIPVTLIDSSFNVSDNSLKKVKISTISFGAHPSATRCVDFPAYLTQFQTHWTLNDPDSIQENGYPGDPPSGERYVWDLAGCSDGQMFYDQIRPFFNTAQIDTYKIDVRFDGDANYYHHGTLVWPTVLAEYFDTCKLIKNFGLGSASLQADMRTGSSFTIPTPSDLSLFIRYTIYAHNIKNFPGPPAAVTLTSPTDGSIVITSSPMLSWAPASSAFYYGLQVSKRPNFSTFVFNDTLSATSKLIPGLQSDSIYYWRVYVQNQYGASYFQSSPFHFTVKLTPPPPPLISPANNATGVSLNPILVWNHGDTTVTGYRLQVSTVANFATTVVDDNTLTDTTKTIGPLLNCQTYFWRVAAKNAQGFGIPNTTAFQFRVTLATPAVPVLVGPASNATVSTTPTLSWTGDICSDMYRLEVANDIAFTSLVVNQVAATSSRGIGPLIEDQKYYWRVKAMNALDSSAVTNVDSFKTILSPPGVPVLVTPTNGDINASATPLFVWRATNAAFYYIQLATDNGFSSIIASDSTVTDTTKQFGNVLSNCLQYFWRVRAKNASGISAFSASRNFTVVKAVPLPPALTTPADGATGVAESPTLTWTNNNNFCTQYFILTVTDSISGSVIERDSLITTSKTINPLGSLVKYFWKVEAENNLGKTASATFRFISTAATTPPPPVLRSPLDGQGDILVTPTLSWDTSARAVSYRLQVAYDSLFTQLAKNDSTITQPGAAQVTKQIGPLLNSRTYYWRVNAKNFIGTSAYSDTFRFTTLFPPAAPVLISPYNGAVDVPAASPQFTWTVPERAESYRLQVSTDTGFVVLKFDDSTITETNWTIGVQLHGFTRFYWRVTAKNSVGYGAKSQYSTFVTTRVGAANWTIPISVCETGPACDTVYFGITPSASYGIDPGLGEYELPQAPPFGWFDVRFIDNRVPPLIGEGLRINCHAFRSYGQVDTFRIKFQPGTGSYPIKISWDPIFIRTICDSIVIKDELGGSTIRQHMETSSSVNVANSSISTLIMIQYGAFPIPTDVKPPVTRELPKGFALAQNYPNPFNPTTRIQFGTEFTARITLTVYDVLGREISRLAQSTYYPGTYTIEWDGKNDQGRQMPSGLYYVRMMGTTISSEGKTSVPFVGMRKMIMMK